MISETRAWLKSRTGGTPERRTLDQVASRLEQLATTDDAIHGAEGERFLGVERSGGEHELGRPGRPDEVR